MFPRTIFPRRLKPEMENLHVYLQREFVAVQIDVYVKEKSWGYKNRAEFVRCAIRFYNEIHTNPKGIKERLELLISEINRTKKKES